MRFNSALLLGAFAAGTASFVAANDLGRPGPAVVSGHVARSEPGAYSSGVHKRQDVPVAETSTATETATETSTSAPSGPSETPAPIGGTVHMADNSTAVNGTDLAHNATGLAGNTTNDNGTTPSGGTLSLGVSAGALFVPLGMAFGALVLGSGALLG